MFRILVLGVVAVGLTVWQKIAVANDLAAPFQCEEPFMFIALISFLSTAALLFAVSLATTPLSPANLRGLVFRASFHDSEAQSALEARGGEEDQ